MPPNVPTLGRLQTVDLREVWASEPYSFTPWLAEAENLQFLADVLGLPALELVRTEHAVDTFSADIVARVADSEDHVLIENQLERTDHIHLGQLLTYAPRFDAKIVVWVARQFTEAHRAAIEWLNGITSDRYAFFAVEVQAVRIGDSLPAPQFRVLAQPNSWTKSTAASASAAAEATTLSPEALSNIDYWEAYHRAAVAAGAPLRRASRPLKDTNYWIPLAPRGDVYLSTWRSHARKPVVGAFLGLYNAPMHSISDRLLQDREALDAAFGEPLDWSRNPSGAVTKILLRLPVADPNDRSDWPRQHEWLIERTKRLEMVFGPVVEEALAAFYEGLSGD